MPVEGSRARLSDLSRKRDNLVVSYGRGIDVSTLDPTVSGATLESTSATFGNAIVLDLPATGWRGPSDAAGSSSARRAIPRSR